jgi:hypothetical protein
MVLIMKTFYIYDSFVLPTAPNHLFFVKKFANGFAYNGYTVKKISNPNEIIDDGFIIISDHDLYHSFGARHNYTANGVSWYFPTFLKKIDKLKLIGKISTASQKKELKDIASKTKNKDITLLAWFRDDQNNFIDSLGIPVIYTGELYYDIPISQRHRQWQQFYNSHKNALPIEFAADIDPSKIGEKCLNEKYTISFVGNKNYKPLWRAEFKDDPSSKIMPTPPFISEKERLNIYKNSMMSLGLHAEINIRDSIVNERVFEAAAYGEICLTDNPYAPIATNGCSIFINNPKYLRKTVKNLKNNPEERYALRRKGFEMIRKNGTYAHKAKQFIELSDKL